MRPFLLAALLAVAAPDAAIAVPVTVTFEVTSIARSSTDDPLGVYPGDVSESGYFTFDDVLPAGATFSDTVIGLSVFDASFSWFGLTFDESRIRIWNLIKDDSGQLIAWGIGSDQAGSPFCQPLNCVSHGGPIDDFYAVGVFDATLIGRPPGTLAQAVMARANVPGAAFGEGTTQIIPVSEPATVGLFAAAFALAGLRRSLRMGIAKRFGSPVPNRPI